MNQLLMSLVASLMLLRADAAELSKVEILTPYLQDLAQCESGGRPDIKILDTNNYYSYGKYQYQLATWKKYGIEFGYFEKDISDAEARKHIYKEWLQDDMTLRIFLNYPEAWRMWYNCSKKVGLDTLYLGKF